MTDRVEISDNDVLLIVDVQNDFCQGGALEVPSGDEVVGPINRLAERCRHVVLTQDWHPAGHLSFASSHPGRKPLDTITMAYGPQILWPDHCVQGTFGAELHGALQAPHAELVLRKGYNHAIDSYSAFFENDHQTPTGLAGYLLIFAFATRPKTRIAPALERSWLKTLAGASMSGVRLTTRAGASRGLISPALRAI
jgi:nicotinamidase/pyrazinamidase